MSAVIAFFDLDNTLYEGYVGEALFRHHLHHRVGRLALLKYAVIHYPMLPLSKIGLFPYERAYDLWGKNIAWLLKGMSEEEVGAMWTWILQEILLPKRRSEMNSELDWHQKKNHRIVFISGSPTSLVDQLAQTLGANDVIATPLEIVNGIYTGKIIPPLNVGEGKLENIHKYLAGFGGDLTQAYFYSDSIVDLPVFEIVGNPVAVYPDNDLFAFAKERDWQIIGKP